VPLYRPIGLEILVVGGSPGYLSVPDRSRTRRSGDIPDT
jgi:hypothetical protein